MQQQEGRNTLVIGAARRAVMTLLMGVVMSLVVLGSLGPAGPAEAEARNGVRFMAVNQHGSPVRWDGDRPIRVVLNVGDPWQRAAVHRALGILTAATGLAFQYVGDTAPVPSRAAPQPAPYWERPDRAAPYDLLIATVPTGRTDLLAPGHRALTVNGWSSSMLRATVVLDQASLPAGWHVGSFGSVLLHELGHVMGLAHVDDRRALMYPTDGEASFFSPAEWEALRFLGNGRGQPYRPERGPDGAGGPAPGSASPRPAAAAAGPASSARSQVPTPDAPKPSPGGGAPEPGAAAGAGTPAAAPAAAQPVQPPPATTAVGSPVAVTATSRAQSSPVPPASSTAPGSSGELAMEAMLEGRQ